MRSVGVLVNCALALGMGAAGGWCQPEIGPLPRCVMYYLQLRGANDGGVSLPSEILAAFVPEADTADRVLIVNGYDRFDWDVDEMDNRRNFTVHHAKAIEAASARTGIAIQLDSASNEAVATGAAPLTGYRLVDWYLGEEGTAEETFSAAEQTLVAQYRAGEGTLLVSGSNIAFDLDSQGSTSDRVFLETELASSFSGGAVSDRRVAAGSLGLFRNLAFKLDDGSGDAYALLEPDALTPRGSGFAHLRYSPSDSPAGVERVEMTERKATVCLGFPFEAIQDAEARAEFMERLFVTLLPPTNSRGSWVLYR